MTFKTTPWMIGGGAEVDADLGRMVAYQALGKNEGIADVGDLKVRALSVPGPSVLISDGGAAILNRSEANSGQTYIMRNIGDEELDVPNTAGSSRSDLVIARIIDPQYAPWPDLDPEDDPVTYIYSEPYLITNVPSTTKKVMDLNGGAGLGYSALAVARIDRPAGASTVLDSQIVDLRKIAQPRRDRQLRAYALVSGDGTTTMTSTTEQAFPSPTAAQFALEIPEWATRARILAHWNQVRIPAGNSTGHLWVKIGSSSPVTTQQAFYDTPNASGLLRTNYTVADDIAIPSSKRGTTQTFYLRGNYATYSATSARIQMDAASSVDLDVEFYEQAV